MVLRTHLGAATNDSGCHERLSMMLYTRAKVLRTHLGAAADDGHGRHERHECDVEREADGHVAQVELKLAPELVAALAQLAGQCGSDRGGGGGWVGGRRFLR